jgi:hypothetical protein
MDILDIKAASKISLPTKELQMLCTMCQFAVVLVVALRPTSKLFRAFKIDIVEAYDSIQPRLETLAESPPPSNQFTCSSYVGSSCVSRNTGLRWKGQWGACQLPTPNFKTLYEAIKYKQWLCPKIPVTYLVKKKARHVIAQIPENRGGNIGKGGGPPPSAPALSKQHSYKRNAH